MLCGTILNSIIIRPILDGDFKAEKEEYPVACIISKFFCVVVLHLSTQPKLNEALERLRYIKRHPYKFERITIPILICILKVIAELSIEFTSLFITAVQGNVCDIVWNYIAIICVSELDEIYYE